MSTRARRILTAVVAAGLLTGCGAMSGAPADDEERRAVASFYPLAWVTEQVAGDQWTVTNLTAPGGEPHDLAAFQVDRREDGQAGNYGRHFKNLSSVARP